MLEFYFLSPRNTFLWVTPVKYLALYVVHSMIVVASQREFIIKTELNICIQLSL